MPISGCHDLPLATFNLPSRNRPQTNAKESPSDIGATSKAKKQHRHSGIFRVADLRPETMPRGKYPESPAPAGSHALISRTPTPGGMLHANLGLPRPPPRNFQPPLPQPPSNKRKRIPQTELFQTSSPAPPQGGVPSTLWRHACLTTPVVKPSPPQSPSKQTATAPPHKTKNLNPSCCRSRGGMRAWPVHRPTHAPTTSPQNKRQQRPPHKPKTPRAVTLWSACVSDHSRGQALAPANPLSPNGNNTPPQKQKTLVLPLHRRLRLPGRSTGQHMLPQQALKTNGNNAPPQNQKPLVPSLCGGMRV